MNRDEAAALLNGLEYGDEERPELFKQMKKDRLVAVFGASDNLMEFRGTINDEVGAINGTTVYVDRGGLVVNKCDEGSKCPNWTQHGVTITANWAPESMLNTSWLITTDIPHATFDLMEEGDIFCRGVVISLDELEV